MTNSIHNRAMLVSLKLSKWSATKYDKKVSLEIAKQHNADADAGRYNKRLISKGKNSYAELMTLFGALYAEHIKQTLPWSDEGWRILPNANHGPYTAMVRDKRHQIETALEAFLLDYPALQAHTKATSNGLYNPADFPSVIDLRKRFGVNVHYSPIPAGEDFRVGLDTATLQEIARDTEDRVNRAVMEAQADTFERLHRCVEHIAEVLSEKKPRIYDSMMENALELTNVLTRLNVTDDPRLEELRKRVERLAQVDSEALRTLPYARKSTASEARSILDSMNAAFGQVVNA